MAETTRPPAGEDMTGFEKEHLLVLGPTNEIRGGRRMWECLCRRCGALFERSKARILELVGACPTCATAIRPPPSCKACGAPDHTASSPSCPRRRAVPPKQRGCRLCGGLAHRVQPEQHGARCRRCGLHYRPEGMLRVDPERRVYDRTDL